MLNLRLADLRRYLVEKNIEDLKRVIDEARTAGRLKELSSALMTAVMETPEYDATVDRFLEDLFDSPDSLSSSPHKQIPTQSLAVEPDNPKPASSTMPGAASNEITLEMQHTLEWVRKDLARELLEADNAGAASRRLDLLQSLSVIKYVSGDKLGLIELCEYKDRLQPMASYMMYRYYANPDWAGIPREERVLLQQLQIWPE